MKGSGAPGNIRRAAARSPPCMRRVGAPFWDRMSIVTTLLALLIEATVGYPQAVVRAIGHPVMWIGRLISWLDRSLNKETDTAAIRRGMGFAALICIVAVPGVLGWMAQSVLMLVPLGIVMVAVLASTLIAQRSLYEHVAR